MKAIALDSMGGDNMPQAAIEGALKAQQEGVPVLLVGNKTLLEKELEKYDAILPVHNATDVIGMQEHASDVRRRQESSIMQAMQITKESVTSACVSMGHSGATMAAALLVLGRLKGVDRPAILTNIPTSKGFSALIDAGANADCKVNYLQQFAVMGSVYARDFYNKEDPTVGLVSIGEEKEKGNKLTLEVHGLLKDTQGINFYGNVEGSDLFKGITDVVVTDGFTGNVMLKLAEGEAKVIFSWIRESLSQMSCFRKLAAALVKPAFRHVAAKLDPSEYGAQPLLGVRGYTFIGHGAADAKAVYNALKTAKQAVEANLTEKIETGLQHVNKS